MHSLIHLDKEVIREGIGRVENWRSGVCSISSSPSSNRTLSFPEYGFPIIFFQRLSLSEPTGLLSVSYLSQYLHTSTGRGMVYIPDSSSDACVSGMSSFFRRDIPSVAASRYYSFHSRNSSTSSSSPDTSCSSYLPSF